MEKSVRGEAEDRRKLNRPVRTTAVIMGLLFLSMLAYFLWFEIFGRQAVIDNPNNNRFDTAENKVIRGEIRTSDGVVIAGTEEGKTKDDDVRFYQHHQLFAPITGYTAMGKTNLEASFNSTLMTSGIDPLSMLKNDLLGIRSPGNNVITTIDSDLQHFCYTLLGERTGSITVMEPATGKILAMVSNPTYDPNTVKEDWEWLTSPDNNTGCLLNRSTQGIYPPGSTFKIVTAIEYMREHPDTYRDFHFVCTGSYTDREGNIVHCDSGTAHGKLDLKHAVAHSCNCAFVCMSETLDPKKYRELCEELGFNDQIIDELPSRRSVVTVNEGSSVFEISQTAFGQGYTTETPLQNLMITAMAANRGKLMKPEIIERIEDGNGKVKETVKAESLGEILTADQAEYLNECLVAVVNEGTTPQAQSEYCQTAGKSGSAQYSAGLDDLHAWFTGYAPAENAQIAVTVMLEKGGHGSPDAAPLFKQVVDYYFSR